MVRKTKEKKKQTCATTTTTKKTTDMYLALFVLSINGNELKTMTVSHISSISI